MIKLFSRLLCYLKGHIGLQRGQEYTSVYKEIKGYGAFGYGVYYGYAGRLYRCSRCGELCICNGVTSWELQDLVSDTLKNLPKINWDGLYHDYDICRLYKK